LEDFVIKLREQRYAPSSIKTYKNALSKFFVAFNSHDLKHLSIRQIQNFISKLHDKDGISPTYQRQIISAINKYYGFYFNRKLDMTFLNQRRTLKRLPRHLSVAEVKALINVCKNLKHMCIMKLLYGCGLRVSEVITLKISDIDSGNMRILIRNTKGKKDRTVALPKSLLLSLDQYYRLYQPKTVVFEGQKAQHYSPKSIQVFVKKYAQKAKIQIRVTPHMLRHSYATHQLENGVSIQYLQAALGHKNITTTELYNHVANSSNRIKINPLDHL
jgi:site-specific recombinase XerD